MTEEELQQIEWLLQAPEPHFIEAMYYLNKLLPRLLTEYRQSMRIVDAVANGAALMHYDPATRVFTCADCESHVTDDAPLDDLDDVEAASRASRQMIHHAACIVRRSRDLTEKEEGGDA